MTVESADMQLMTAEDYLVWEETQGEKHEYVGGMVYAMSGGTNAHAAIIMNVGGTLHAQLRGKSCRAFSSDLKVRIQYPTHTRFYYPDVTVACKPAPEREVFHDEPAVIVEVASESTRRTDELEKRDAYQMIPTLRVYLLVEQERAAVVVWRRGARGFQRETYTGLDAVIALSEIEARLALADIYEAVRIT